MSHQEQNQVQVNDAKLGNGIIHRLDKHGFEDWLRCGLEKFVLQGVGPESFPGATADLARFVYPAEGLEATYHRLTPEGQKDFRLAVANLISSWEVTEENVVLLEHLLHLAALLPVKEVLRGLPSWLKAGHLQRIPQAQADALFEKVFLAATRLAAPTQESADSIRELIALPQFRPEWAGMALEALWSCDAQNILKHLQRLRPYLSKLMFNAPNRPRIWAKRLLDAVHLYRIAQTLPQLKYFNPRSKNADLDTWLLEGLLGGDRPLVQCWINDESQLHFCLTGQFATSECLQIEGWSDLYEFLRCNNLLIDEPLEPVAATPDFEDFKNKIGWRSFCKFLGSSEAQCQPA